MENCPSLKCFYSILGVEKGSSASEIRTAYRKLAMRWHPDKCSNMKGDAEEQAKLKFQVVQEAYSVLSDKNKRLLYDAGLHNTDDDPCMQDFMAELVSMMKGACSASTKKHVDVNFSSFLWRYVTHGGNDVYHGQQSSADHEFEKLSKLFTDIADADDYLGDRQQFDSSRRSHCQEEHKMRHQPFAAYPPPKPHPNLVTAMGCSEYKFSGNFDQASRSFGCEFEQPATSCPQPHPNLDQEPHFSDIVADPVGSDQDFLGFMRTQDSTLQEPQHSNMTPVQDSVDPGQSSQRSSEINFASVSQTCTAEKSTIMGGATAAPSLNSEGFCMGVSGDGPGRDYRGQGKTTKSRRKPRCKERMSVVAPPASTCKNCGVGRLCLCTNNRDSESGSLGFSS